MASHLANGTRPHTETGDPWSYEGFAKEVATSRSDAVSPRAVSNWCAGRFLPKEIEPILRALFGPEGSGRHAAVRKELREAYQAAWAERHGAVVARARPNPVAGRWVVEDDTRLVQDDAARPSDQRAATDPLHQQLQQALRRMAGELALACGENARGRFDNSSNFLHLPSATQDFRVLVERDPREIPAVLGELYPLLLRLGRFLETDDDLRRREPDEALDANTRGLLIDLMRTAAPWGRGFPTVAGWDDQNGRFLMQAALFRRAPEVAAAARRREVIAPADAERIARLAEIADEHAALGRKAGNRAAAEANNLILALAQLTAAALAGAVAPARAELARRSGATLADAADHVAAFAETQPPDLRQALLALAAEGGRLEREGPVSPGPALEPVPEDVEQRARDMILRGEAPPAAWRPFIQTLSFSDTALDGLLGLEHLTWLQVLSLARTQIADLGPLSRLIGLKFLDLDHTPASDTTALASLTELETLRLWGTQVSDLTPLALLTSLRFLDLERTSVSDLSPLAGLAALERLDLGGTQVSDVSALAGLTALQYLDLSCTQASDVSGLAGLAGLQALHLRGTQVGDLSVLAGLTGLRFLYLDEGQPIDVSPLANLKDLEIIRLPRREAADAAGEQG